MTKLKSASRFGARYSSPLKKIVAEIEEIQKKKQVCPRCGRKSLKRTSYARWECTKCKAVIAGGAYAPQTEMGSMVDRIIKKGEKYEEIVKEIEKKDKEEKKEEDKEENKEKQKKKSRVFLCHGNVLSVRKLSRNLSQ